MSHIWEQKKSLRLHEVVYCLQESISSSETLTLNDFYHLARKRFKSVKYKSVKFLNLLYNN